VTGIDAIRTGFFSSFAAQANLSNNTSQTVTPTWSSSNSAVATVAANGDVSGVSNGLVTISATYQNVTGSKTVRIVSNFGGNWSGTYRISKCDQSAAFAGWCVGIGGVGALLPVSLALTQSGNQRDQIAGTISLGSISGDTSGNVTGDGRLVIGGTFTNFISPNVFSITIGGWETRLSGASSMSGGWSQNIRANGFSGNAYQENTLVSITHTVLSSTGRQDDIVDSSVMKARGGYELSWPEFFALMRRTP
jgi:hypothetical protein